MHRWREHRKLEDSHQRVLGSGHRSPRLCPRALRRLRSRITPTIKENRHIPMELPTIGRTSLQFTGPNGIVSLHHSRSSEEVRAFISTGEKCPERYLCFPALMGSRTSANSCRPLRQRTPDQKTPTRDRYVIINANSANITRQYRKYRRFASRYFNPSSVKSSFGHIQMLPPNSGHNHLLPSFLLYDARSP